MPGFRQLDSHGYQRASVSTAVNPDRREPSSSCRLCQGLGKLNFASPRTRRDVLSRSSSCNSFASGVARSRVAPFQTKSEAQGCRGFRAGFRRAFVEYLFRRMRLAPIRQVVEDCGRGAQMAGRPVTGHEIRLAKIRIFEIGQAGPYPAALVAPAGMGAPAGLLAAVAPYLQ